MSAKRRYRDVLPVPLDVLHHAEEERRAGASDGRPLDVLLARLATRQSGVVRYRQLRALGFTRSQIARRVQAGRLIRVHRGVYAVGHEALSDRARMVAGLLAAGHGAVLSHRTAAALWKLLPSMPPFVEVTLTERVPRSRRGVRVHQAKEVESTAYRGLPVTAPRQTVRDLNDERITAEALYLGLIDRAGAPPGAEPTRSELERTLLRALARAQLPRPLVNHPLGAYRLVFFWPDHALVVETDGWAGHGHRVAFERDRARDADLHVRGLLVLRFTWRQVMEETLLVTVRVAQLLARTPHHAPDTPPAGG